MTTRTNDRFQRAHRRRWMAAWAAAVAYLAALVASRIIEGHRQGAAERAVQFAAARGYVEIATVTSAGAAAGAQPPRTMLSYLKWPAEGSRDAGGVRGLPLVLLHGGPGEASDFARMGPMLAAGGGQDAAGDGADIAVPRDVYSLDLLGFGQTTRNVPDYSILANALATLALMDALKIERAHILGWSQGGGVALHLCDLAPGRVASLTLLASIGAQETEGSGSHAFEHARYRVGGWLAWQSVRLIPHFGLLHDPAPAVLGYFADSDQRPLAEIMRRVRVPTLILQGRRDFLVGAWAARHHHALMPTSRLVLLPVMHFMPFMQADLAAAIVGSHIARHDREGVEPLTGVRDEHERGVMDRFEAGCAWVRLHAPWWVLAAAIGLAWRARPSLTIAGLGLLTPAALVDYGLALAGMWGVAAVFMVRDGVREARPRGAPGSAGLAADWIRRRERAPAWSILTGALRPDLSSEIPVALGLTGVRPLAIVAWGLVLLWRTTPTLLISSLVVGRIAKPGAYPWGIWGAIAGVSVAWLALTMIEHAPTRVGRRLIWIRVRRAIHHEFWPTWLFYFPILPGLVWLGLKHRSPIAFTACNPGIPSGGGIVGESKFLIMQRLSARTEARTARDVPAVEPNNGAEAVSPTFLIDAAGTPQERSRRTLELIAGSAGELAFPVILKPDSGQRGYSVRMARGPEHVAPYFRAYTRDVIVQPWHPGPGEIGVVWVRTSRLGEPVSGRIFSITGKRFGMIAGDGRRTLEELVYGDARLSLQASTILARHRSDRSRVIGTGETLAAAIAGNHCQGTMFVDDTAIATPELESAVNLVAARYVDAEGRPGLDIGRFDIRFRSMDDLRAGRLDPGSVIELNGTLGESTNIYDPAKNLLWAYGVLFAQWRELYRLGRERLDAGGRTVRVGELLRTMVGFYRGRPGSAVSD